MRTPEARFLEKIKKTPTCWLWTGALFESGYGGFRVGPKTVYAHRYSWRRGTGRDIPEGLSVLHSCDVRSCVNPDHLRVGTHADNMRDVAERGNRKGRVGYAKLSPRLVRTIRRRYELENVTTRSLAKDYGVDHSNIVRAINGNQWSWV